MAIFNKWVDGIDFSTDFLTVLLKQENCDIMHMFIITVIWSPTNTQSKRFVETVYRSCRKTCIY